MGEAFADGIFADPRFVLDKDLYAPAPSKSGERSQPKKRAESNYDYAISEEYLEKARAFLEDKNDVFAQEEKRYAIPKEVIVVLLVVETRLGEKLGRRPVITTLYTRAVVRTHRQKPEFAERELIAFLRICEKNDLDPFSIYGSATGAFGLPQFEPTSYPGLAARYLADGKPPDLFTADDAIWSVGNYLHQAGWDRGKLSREQVLLRYNRQLAYVDVILDGADILAGRTTPHRHYIPVDPILTERAAIK